MNSHLDSWEQAAAAALAAPPAFPARRLPCGWLLAAAIGTVCSVGVGTVPSAQAQYAVQRLVGGLNQPIYVTQAPGDDDTLYIVERNDGGGQLGRIRTWRESTGELKTFLDLTGSIEADGGVLSLAFHPNFAANQLFYVAQNDRRVNSIDEYRVVRGVPRLERRLLEYANLVNNFHTINWLGFRPNGSANELFLTAGDGGTQANQPQFDPALIESPSSPYGKVLRLRLDVDYPTPADGPAHPGIDVVALGLRNPYRASFDRATGDMYLGDVGFQRVEEINFIPSEHFSAEAPEPLDFGWTDREGTIATQASQAGGSGSPGDVEPIFDYVHSAISPNGTLPHPSVLRGDSVTGGYVYRGGSAPLDGRYFFGDFTTNRVYSGKFDASTPLAAFDGTNLADIRDHTEHFEALSGHDVNFVVSFGEDNRGNLYIVDFGDGFFPPLGTGEIFRVAASDDLVVERSDLNADGRIDAADWTLFVFHHGTSFDGLSGIEALRRGDLDRNGLSDLRDFELFKHDYVDANGSAAFEALFAVPEPTAAVTLAIFGCLLNLLRSRRR